MALDTKEEIMREYGMLAYVPGKIANNAMCGVWTLRRVREMGVENLGWPGVGGEKEVFLARVPCRRGLFHHLLAV
jgi:hypothetical protein